MQEKTALEESARELEITKTEEKLLKDEIQIYLSNGSDESISQLIMAFCEPGIDNIITLPPTFGMYKVSAHVHGIKVKEVPLDGSFQIDAQLVLEKSKKASLSFS